MNGKAFLLILAIAFLLFPASFTLAQTASAEFISSIPPQKLISGEQVADGVQHLFLQDNRLYVVNIWAGLQILDVSNARQPKELGKFELTKRIRNVHVDGDYAFLSVELEGVYILDISNPANIKQVARVTTKNSEAYWVTSRFPFLYIAEGPTGVSIYNIREPERPRLSATFDTPGWAWGLYLSGSDLYVADKSSGLLILDVSDPAGPKKRGQFIQMRNTKTIQVEDNLAYVANGPDGLFILDVSNPELPFLVTKVPIEGYAFFASKTGNSAFIANELGRSIEIIDVTDPRRPVKSGSYSTEGKVYSAVKRDVYVYVAADNQTLILRQNFKPVIAEIEDQVVDENFLLMVRADAYDPDGDDIFFTVKNLPEGAEFDSLSGDLSWIPTYEQSGSYPNVNITVIEKTDSRLSSDVTFNITVNHVNRNPSLPDIPDYQVDENQTITFTIPEGSDPDIEDKGRLTYSAQGLPEGASFNPQSRIFTWTPTFEQSGIYAIDFAVHDPAGGVDRNVSTITVNHVDRKPTLEPIANQIVNENELLQITLKGSDPDREDQDKLSYRAENLPAGAVFDPATATFSWTPTYDQSGQYDNLLYIFTAGALSDSITFNVTVNHVNRPPVLDVIADKVINENEILRFTISGSDPDVEDSGKLKFSAENLPLGATFNADSLLFRWTPTFEQSGVYENIIFKVTDPSELEASQAMTITVSHVNRPPVLAEIEPKVVDENSLLTFTLQGSDPDREDQGKLQYSAQGLPEGAVLQGADFSWTPTYEQSGVYTVTFSVSDGQLSDPRTTTITVNHVNRPPELDVVASHSVDENENITFTVKGSDPDKEDEGKLKIRAANLPEGAQFDTLKAEFNWTPTYEQSGAYTVSFTVSDPAGLSRTEQVQVVVNHVNRTPVFAEQAAQVVDENSPLTYNLIPAVDPDREDEGKLTYTAENLPAGAVFDAENLILRWTPSFEQSGTYTINLTVSDGQFSVSQPLTITVNHVNRPPVISAIADQIINENEPWSLKVEYSDPDEEDQGKLVIAAENLPEGGTFDKASATFQWTPTYEQSGEYPGITVTVTDPAGLSDSKTFAITVNHVNRAPALQALTPITVNENEPVAFTLVGSDPDKEDEGKLRYSAENLPDGTTLDAQSGAFAWTPTFLQAGVYNITCAVSDPAGLTAQQSMTITVNDVNRPPVLKAVPAQSVNENEELTFTIEGRDEDTDNTLVYSAENLPADADFDAASGTFRWKPDYEQAGEYQVTFKLSDGTETVSQTAQITVNNVNRPPTISAPASQEVEVETPIRLQFSASDPDGDELTFEAGNLPSGADFNSRTGELVWTPSAGQAGEYAIVVKVSDGQAEASARTTIRVKEKPQPEPPEAPEEGDEN